MKFRQKIFLPVFYIAPTAVYDAKISTQFLDLINRLQQQHYYASVFKMKLRKNTIVALLQMKKLNIAALQRAFDGK
ncbi:hypothetical protein [Cytophaga hutchinsonii]|uniref:Uncharacterized protein n=1 Tax=Cytophaga hutchinsonii (strain ATCC 33406 / DSM 1761 / CIP 103989 / NBRC 15051 / NCIMB 9469 / D465) TaxID=269798 RepID=A0A6N4ST82_CYTH3|nr:hypothetical protein [Cytophaga hutchinsonii]ABG59419.1 hypothetical protein CHU_2156 [Cytophaga hutchinsonii ATCC 33406]